ncbi:MAG: DeoR/GlpR family DNA-binding transcription regulator [Anaerolineae bacterium]|nr:DeoR/GlpR family DNA-binding transcription regulator [Anaerolineae bacterium]
MLKEERQHLILEILRKNGKVLATELSLHFGVSEDTIRRDLHELDQAGKMVRVHGGGLPRSPAGNNFTERLKQWPESKAAIARAALQMIHTDEVIILDGSTTTLHVAEILPPDLRATIITNSPVIADTLADHARVDVVLVGGKLYKESRVTTGAATVETFRAIHADICFLGICSLHPEVGISTVDMEESYVKQAMLNGSNRVVALSSYEKLGTASPFIVAPISALTDLITEKSAPEDVLLAYQQAGIRVELV